jgi:hypothetical protein
MFFSSAHKWCKCVMSHRTQHRADVGDAKFSRRWCLSALLTALATFSLIAFVCPKSASATPETYYPVAATLGGPAAGSRFGESVACSHELPLGHTYQNTSFIAVGAPDYDGGRGAVYIYNADNPATPVQVILAPAGEPANFGAAVAFVPDGNADGIDELIIGQPYDQVSSVGRVYGYVSSLGATPYSFSGSSLSGVQGYGARIVGLRKSGLTPFLNDVHFVVANPDTGEVAGHYMTVTGSTGTLHTSSLFVYDGEIGFGHAMCELPEVVGGRIGVGSPLGSGVTGEGFTLDEFDNRTEIFAEASEYNFAWGISGYLGGTYIGVSSPVAGKVHVQSATTLANLCSVSLPMNNMPITAFQSLVDQEGVFNGLFSELLVGGTDTTLASFRDEASTGGSVGVLGAGGGSFACYGVKQVNNCVADVNQQQGHTVVGGASCMGRQSSPTGMLVSAAPGYNGGTGRVDIYYAADRYASAQGCATATPTATPTVTPSATPTLTPTETPVPTDPPASSTSVPDVGDRVVAVQPGTANLPAPGVVINANRSVVLTAPRSIKSADFARILARLLGLSQRDAKKAARSATFSYQFTLTQTSSPASFSSLSVSALAKSLPNQKRAKRKNSYISSRNRITLNKLAPGTYVARYRVVIGIKRTKRTFYTRYSASVKFTVP